MKPRKILITKEKLQEYLEFYKIIEVVPIKDEEPILILISMIPTLSTDYPDRIIIHKGYFILPSGFKRGSGPSKSISYITYTDVNYMDKFKASHPSKQFLIQSILDNEIPVSDTTYIRPVKDFFRKYDILMETRGKTRKVAEDVKERNRIIIEEYNKSKRKIPLPIKRIKDKLAQEIKKKIDLGKYFAVNDATIRRVIKAYIKSRGF